MKLKNVYYVLGEDIYLQEWKNSWVDPKHFELETRYVDVSEILDSFPEQSSLKIFTNFSDAKRILNYRRSLAAKKGVRIIFLTSGYFCRVLRYYIS